MIADCNKNGLEIAKVLLVEAGSSMDTKNRRGETASSMSTTYRVCGPYLRVLIRHNKERMEVEADLENAFNSVSIGDADGVELGLEDTAITTI